MAKFKIEVIETLSKVIEVEANSEVEANVILSQKYHDEEIILDSSDHLSTEFKVLKD
jgi:hypothetical protein|tara:strand:+ start:1489 stop:1659 length:171 start_codon:yes stop_codon:yes gene_type:complete